MQENEKDFFFKSQEKGFSLIKEAIRMIDTFGVLKIITAAILMVFISYATYITFNPSIMFEKYSEYEEKKHNESFFSRMESTPIVQSMLNDALIESGALRTFIIEMHNGKYNASGLSFNFGSMTYEGLRDSTVSISEDYSDFTLERYPIFSVVYKRGQWGGTLEELSKIDHRIALKIESNDAHYLALYMIYGRKTEIGFIGATFGKNDTVNEAKVNMVLAKYASKVSPYLDGDGIKK